MGRFKKNMARRFLACLLSGAMIMSNMTAFASEPSIDTGGGYYGEIADAESTNTGIVEETEADEIVQNEDNDTDGNDDVKESSEEAAAETEAKSSEQTTETQTSDETQASETESFLSTENEEEEKSVSERDNKGENPDSDGFCDGFIETTVGSGKSYYFDFTKITKTDDTAFSDKEALDNNYSKGLFKFNAGSKNGAQYWNSSNGVAFKYDNRLTFPVAGDSYIVVGGNNNNKCTNLEASCTTGGIVSPETQTSVTSGQADLAACKTRGANTIVYTYVGTGGNVTLKLNTEGDAPVYLAYVCIIPRKAPATEWNFKSHTAAAETKITEWNGLEISNGKKHNSAGLAASAGTIKVPIGDLSKEGKVVVKASYEYSFTIGDGEKIKATEGNTDNIDTFEYYYKAGTAEVVINVSGTSYFDSIKVVTDALEIKKEDKTWDFTKSENTGSIQDFDGLAISGGSLTDTNNGRLLALKSGSVMIPVAEDCKITVYTNNSWTLAFYDYSEGNIKTKDNSSTTINYNYSGGKGMVPIIVGGGEKNESGNYTVTTYLEKITVEYSSETKVFGTVEKPSGLKNVTLVFTGKENGTKNEAAVGDDGNYSVNLKDGDAYQVSLKDAPGYDIVNVKDKMFNIPSGTTEKTINLLICESETNTEIKHYTLEADRYSKQNADEHNAGQSLAGKPDQFFTIYMNKDFSIDGTTEREFASDGNSYVELYQGTNRLNFSSNETASRSGEIAFTITGHSVLWVYWMSSSNSPYLVIRNADGKIAKDENGTLCAEKVEDTTKTNVSSFTIPAAGTYYISSATGNSEDAAYGNGNYIYKALIATPVEVTPDFVDGKTYRFESITDTQLANNYKGFNFGSDMFNIGNSHGIQTKNDNTEIELYLKNKATITVTTCCYGKGDVKVPEGTGKLSSTEVTEENGKAGVFTIKDAAAYSEKKEPLKLIVAKGTYIHSIDVMYEIPKRETIDVWDFGGKAQENGDGLAYTNNITIDMLKSLKAENGTLLINKGAFSVTGNTAFGDLTVNHKSSDKLYSSDLELSDENLSSSQTWAKTAYEDGYTADGGYSCNGSAGSSSRYVTIANVKAGDKIAAYIRLSQNGPETLHFMGLGSASGQDDTVTIPATSTSFAKYEFAAEYTGTYKIWVTATTPDPAHGGKPMYHRIMRIPGVAVSGSIDTTTNNCTLPDGYTVKFVNQTTEAETEAEVDGEGNFTATLAPGYEYLAVLSGAQEYGFTDASKIISTEDREYLNGKTGVTLVVEEKKTRTYSGSITGFADDYERRQNLKITLVPIGTSDKIDLNIQEDGTFQETILQEESYTITMENVDDYEISSDAAIGTGADNISDAKITVAPKRKFDVSGGFIDIDSQAQALDGISDLTFTILDLDGNEDEYVYTAVINDDKNGYSVSLRDGAYIAKATVEGYSTNTHVVVNGESVSKDLMFVSTADDGALTRVADLYVGYPNEENNYDTVTKAVKAAKRMNPKNEEERIVIHIAPDTYREQIIVDTPYISFVNDTNEKVLLTWYYGIGYTYYSAGSDGFYNSEKAYDRYEKNGVSKGKWGTAVYVKNSATAFRAEGITFENSFNRYITSAELTDGVEADTSAYTDTSITLERKGGVDVQTEAATERAAALVVEADLAEFKDCGFYSSQDTLYIGAGKGSSYVHTYFKDCVIEGETDYIFGYGDCVFDDCELSWKGYSGSAKAGYITATRFQQDNSNESKGYLFRDCTITANKDLTVVPGYFGRPWGAKAAVVFKNTVLESVDIIKDEGWASMSGRNPKDANYFEYNTTFADQPVDTSKREGGVMTKEEAAAINVSDYFGTWIPEYYVEKSESDEGERADVTTAEPAPTEEGIVSGTKITLTAVPADAEIYYTIDGTNPKVGGNGKIYNKEEGIILNYSDTTGGKITIMAYAAAKDNYKESLVKSFTYTVNRDSSDIPVVTEKVLVFDDLADFAIETATAGEEKTINEDFSVFCHTNTKTGTLPLTWTEDDNENTALSKYLSTGGTVKTNQASIKFTTDGARKVTVYWAANSDGNGPIQILNSNGVEAAASTESNTVKDTPHCTVLELNDAGTYYLGSAKNGIKIYKVVVGAIGGEDPNPPVVEPDPDKPDEEPQHTLWLVGDSTVCTYIKDDGSHEDGVTYYPRYGYGTQIANYETGYYTVKNLALSGRSSKDFTSQPNYTTLQEGISEGDILIIGFGHNDEKDEDPARFTDPNGDYQTEGSFAKSLYDNYVKLAIEKGAQPILCTPVVRRNDKADALTNSNCHITAKGDYAEAIRKLGRDVEVPVVDLTALTKAHYESIGMAETLYLHAWSSSKDTSVDNTHLNEFGAKVVAHMLATELSKLTDLEVSKHIRNISKAPTKADDLKVNPNYKEISYTAPTEGSTLWPDYDIFKGSTFGDLGGNPTNANFTFGADADKNMNIKVANNKGKITDKADGIAMYYYRIPAASTFTLFAKARVNAIGDSNTNQIAFGLMARDDMYIDKNDKTIASDYVAAATFGDSSANCFYRKGGKLTKGSALGTAIAVGETYDLKLSFNGDGYECTFGNNGTQSGGFDFTLKSIDSEYQYIGMFAARNADITFSDIKLTVDGKEVYPSGSGNPDNPDDPNKPDNPDDPNKPDNPDDPNKPDNPDDPNNPDNPGEETGDTEESKIVVDTDTSGTTNKEISLANKRIITVEAADLVEKRNKVQYAVTVTYLYNGRKQQLTEGVHYTVSPTIDKDDESKVSDLKSAGLQKINIIGTGNQTDLGKFVGRRTVSYTIKSANDVKPKDEKAKDISKMAFKLDGTEKKAEYTGTYITPGVILTKNPRGNDGKEIEVTAENYSIVYKNNVNVGKASVTIVGIAPFYGTKTLTFNIKKTDISKKDNVAITASNANIKCEKKNNKLVYTAAPSEKEEEFMYNQSGVTFQNLKIMLGGKELNPRSDYTIAYKKNAQKGTATATIKGMNNLSGAINITYNIKTADIGTIAAELAKCTGDKALPAEYSSKGSRLTSITINGITLKEGTDYKVAYNGCKKAAELNIGDIEHVKVTGAGAYKSNDFKNVPVDIKVIKGSFHVKDGAIVDTAKYPKAGASKYQEKRNAAIISSAKIKDASGAAIKANAVDGDIVTTNTTVTITPVDKEHYETVSLNCHVAAKLNSVKAKVDPATRKQMKLLDRYFDGVNLVTLTETEIVNEGVLDGVKAEDIRIVSYKNNNKVGSATVTVEGRASSAFYGTKNLNFKIVQKKTAAGEADKEAPDTNGKILDVWDFAAGAVELDENGVPTKYLDSAMYNNKLTEDIMNSWYEGVEAGKSGVDIGSFTVKDEKGDVVFEFNGNGKTNNRIRTKNTKITRKDERSLKDADGNEYLGYVYSNSSSTDQVYLGIKLNAGDIVTAVVSSNGGDSLIKFEPVDGSAAAQEYQYVNENAGIAAFYAVNAGEYKIYSTNEKLVVARVIVESTDLVAVSGTVTAPESLKEYGIAFTCKETGAVKTAPVVDGKYTVELNESYSYDVALANANGYVVTNENKSFTLESGLKAFTYDVTVAGVDLVTVAGKVTGLAAVLGGEQNPLAKLKLTFKSGNIYIPEFTLNSETGEYTLVLEKGVEYAVTAEGIDDFTLDASTISAAENKTADITFTAKPVYDVALTPEGVTAEALASVKFTFSRLYVENSVKVYEEDYVYTFTGLEGIKLRDGQYEVKAVNCPYAQEPTADLQIKGANLARTIKFDNKPVTLWNFADGEFTDVTNYKGLLMSGVSKNKTYALGGAAGEYKVPVAGPCTVTASYCYNATGKIADTVDISLAEGDEAYGSTSKEKSSSYEYKGEAGYVVITTTATTYMTKIAVTYPSSVELKDKITVGAAGCDYTSINDALDAVREMNRPENQRVTIEIQPGNYEEMLVIDIPNVTLKNADAAPSIKPINKGVDIEASSVRITSYYGHGYAYYSMGRDCKWDGDLLAVNKENGCLSFENPGTGTTSGSYWNATVVVGADGFEADGIIFENSFNQYVSKKAADDVIVPLSGAKGESIAARNSLEAGDTRVQYKDYVERAAALAIMNNFKHISFNNCSFIGRQDTLYGGENVTAAFYDCDVYGGTDYIFGGMTAVFAKCDLVFNTNDQTDKGKKDDVGYITAAQTKSGRGYLLYNCTVTSTTPNVNTASEKTSKPGYLGRPWEANTGEALFYRTIIGKTDFSGSEESLIVPEAWNAGLGGKSSFSQEYASVELAGVDNSAKRIDWSKVLTADADGNVTLADGTTKVTDATVVAAFLGEWNPFDGKDMTISNGQ